MPQVLVMPAILIVMMIAAIWLPGGVMIAVELVLALVFGWVLAFFRDPERIIPQGDDLLVSPADGKVTDIDTVPAPHFDGQALRIGIFLNIFNVHVSRMPCKARVERIEYKEGQFKNAMDPDSAKVNESNDVTITRLAEPADKLLVRQISGAIARRIVCKATEGQEFAGGQRYGMIKFGSRAELYLPVRDNAVCQVKIGDKVKAGLTTLVRYE